MIKFTIKQIFVITIVIAAISLSLQWFRSWKAKKVSDLKDYAFTEAGRIIAKKI